MKPRPAEMRRHRRAKFQRRAQKCFLQGLSVRRIVSRPTRGIVKKQRLILLPAVFIFRGENLSIARRLPVQIFLLLQHHAERVALPRVGVEVQVVAKNLRQPQRQFRRFPGVLHGIEERIVHPARHRDHFRLGGDFADPRREATILLNDFQHAVRINLVIDFAQRSFYRPPDGDGIPRAKLPQVERALCGR